MLGTADLRLLRLMLQHAVVSYLLPLTLAYVAGLPSGASVDPRLPAALATFFDLTKTPLPPPSASSSSSTSRVTPVTAVTQTVITSHLPAITLATITVAWTPTVPPATHAALRSQLMAVLNNTLSPTQAMGTLSTALKIVQGGKRRPPKGWTRTWPPYVESTIGTLLSNQVLKPGGVKALMENVFGEAVNIAGPEAVDGPKLEQISSLLCRVPRSTTPEVSNYNASADHRHTSPTCSRRCSTSLPPSLMLTPWCTHIQQHTSCTTCGRHRPSRNSG